jgi:hypothetical protein
MKEFSSQLESLALRTEGLSSEADVTEARNSVHFVGF